MPVVIDTDNTGKTLFDRSEEPTPSIPKITKRRSER
jgi:hypothetical protein